MIYAQVVLIASTLATTVMGFPSTPSKARIVSRAEVSQSYDYIVVGGGTSGLTVADRLTENPRSTCGYQPTGANNLSTLTETVLVIETGQLDEGEDAFRIPVILDFGPGPAKYYYNLTSIPQLASGNRTFPLEAGCIVGGGSAINSMFFDRG